LHVHLAAGGHVTQVTNGTVTAAATHSGCMLAELGQVAARSLSFDTGMTSGHGFLLVALSQEPIRLPKA
jgi:hypothetical protein